MYDFNCIFIKATPTTNIKK